jgi:prephenate dehydrogenase
MFIDRLAIIGVGLIGGSLARVLRRADACGTVVGCNRNKETLEKAVELGVIDEFSTNVAEAVTGADVVVLATPLGTTETLLSSMAGTLREDVILTDVGSVKGSVVEAARRTVGDHISHFIPAHPIAGTEKSGVEASFADLFKEHMVILTPLPETDQDALEKITEMWRIADAKVIHLDVEHHDEVLAATSHLPHMLAYALVDCLAGMQERDEIFQFAAGGFADFTRIASSSPEMWHDICFSNREQLLSVLERFDDHIALIKIAIRGSDSNTLHDIFTRAKAARDKFTDQRATRTK